MQNSQLPFLEALQSSPVIAAVKNDTQLQKALHSECTAIFFLYGSILNIGDLVHQAKQFDKLVFIHVDLIEGLTTRDIAADFIAQNTETDGVISTRPNLLHRAKSLGLITIQRFFLLDSLAFDNIVHQNLHADVIDILPGAMPQVISRLAAQIHQPIIASGLLLEKRDILAALSAGALAVSTTCESLWSA